MQTEKKIIKARAALILDAPFFGSMSLRLNLKEDESCETCWVDGINLGYNKDFIDSLQMDELKGLLCHEVMHLALGHHTRRKGRDFEEWNQACDFAINPLVIDAGMVLPDGALLNSSFKDNNAEKIYNTLKQKKQKEQQQQEQQQGAQSSQKQANEQQGIPNQGQEKKSPENGKSCGEVRDYPGNDVDDQKEPTQKELDAQEQEWKIIATQAATQAEKCGKMPGSSMEEVRIMNQPKVNWIAALQRFVYEVATTDWSFTKPNRRYADCDFILPSLHNQKLPDMVVAVDTSGSVSSYDLQQFAGEIEEILNVHDTTIQVIYCDTQVRGQQTFTKEDMPVKLDAKGRGGTRFAPLFDYVNKMDDEPVCVIYLTDLDCNSFGDEPDYPVLWVQTEGRRLKDVPFGEVIKMN